MNAILIVLPILTLLMFDLGLTLKPQDFKLIEELKKLNKLLGASFVFFMKRDCSEARTRR